jgi:hypothetical protein
MKEDDATTKMIPSATTPVPTGGKKEEPEKNWFQRVPNWVWMVLVLVAIVPSIVIPIIMNATR